MSENENSNEDKLSQHSGNSIEDYKLLSKIEE